MNVQNKLYSLLVPACVVLALSTYLSTQISHSQEDQFIEGGHYELLDEVQPVQTGDKIEVVEMFWYRCPHCYKLEPFIVEWLKNIPENAEYVPIPAILSPSWELHARAYYVFEALGVTDELHGKFFTALHGENRNINSVEKLADWAAENGVDRQAVLETYDSFAVENKINFANIMTRKYGITGVPSIIVDGRYRTTVSHAGSQEKLIEIINFLITKADDARGS